MSYTFSTPEPAIERRAAPRTPASGEVVFRSYDHILLKGEVMDVSPTGFRIRYVGKRMRVGSDVEVIHPWNNVRARIAWTIRSGDWIQAGLQMISDDDPPADPDA
jgi:hypothetical protein